MPTPIYTLIDSVTLASSASLVTFSSIPGTFGDLVLATKTVSSLDTASGYMRFNSDSGANYTMVFMLGNGTRAASTQRSFSSLRINTYDSTSIATGQSSTAKIQIFDYSTTDKHKTVLSRGDNAENGVSAISGRWANTAAITSIEFFSANNDYAIGSTFFLYGIAKAL
jgi:hypothetical protein